MNILSTNTKAKRAITSNSVGYWGTADIILVLHMEAVTLSRSAFVRLIRMQYFSFSFSGALSYFKDHFYLMHHIHSHVSSHTFHFSVLKRFGIIPATRYTFLGINRSNCAGLCQITSLYSCCNTMTNSSVTESGPALISLKIRAKVYITHVFQSCRTSNIQYRYCISC